MTVICMASASGSPGVTTTALGMALCWPRPVLLVEADPSGSAGILSGRFRGLTEHPGLIDLVMAHRSGVLAEALPRVVMEVPDSPVSILTGSRSHEQAAGLSRIWEPLLGVLRSIAANGQDVIVDAGRLGLEGAPRPLVAGADLTVLVLRSHLPALAGARSWAAALAADAIPGHAVRALLVGEGRPYRPAEVSRAIRLPILATVGWDSRRAKVFSEGAAKPVPRLGGSAAADRAFEASGYLRSLRAAGEAAAKLAGAAGDRSLLRDMIAARTSQGARP